MDAGWEQLVGILGEPGRTDDREVRATRTHRLTMCRGHQRREGSDNVAGRVKDPPGHGQLARLVKEAVNHQGTGEGGAVQGALDGDGKPAQALLGCGMTQPRRNEAADEAAAEEAAAEDATAEAEEAGAPDDDAPSTGGKTEDAES